MTGIETMKKSETKNQITLPINITLGLGAYTTKLWIGSEQIEVNVLIDTGSSTLAIDLNKYRPENDQHIKTSTYAQDVVYGSGGWAGPVIHSLIELDHDQRLKLNDAPLAITAESQQQNFQQADGIWGLAYHHLNKAYDVSTFLTSQQPELDSTYPWPFTIEESPTAMREFRTYLRQFPEHDITPLFTDFEENNIVANLFTLKTERSIEYVPQADMDNEALENEPLNQGQLIIGGQLPNKPRKSTVVVHDAYYNTHLMACQVAGFDPCEAPPLDEKHINSFFSNAIIDSGCSFLVLQKALYSYVKDCLKQIDTTFPVMIEAATKAYQQGKECPYANMNLGDWPEVNLIFKAPNDQQVTLTVPPQYYWQQHAKTPNNWMFMIMNQLPQWPDQTLCGLPLINSYTCVFDRSAATNGLIHWLDK